MDAAKIRILPDNWTYEDYYNFVKAFQTGDTDTTFKLAQAVIASWDYEVDLAEEDAIGLLGVADSAAVIRTVMEKLGEYLEALDLSEVKVDFSVWNTRKFMHFDGLRRNGKIKAALEMLPEIIKNWEAFVPNDTVSLTAGATMLQAVNEAYKRLVTGKN